jgi:deoxyribodipyrimidine photo-lyase
MQARAMSGEDLFAGFDAPVERIEFTPTRAAGLARLDAFVTRAGRHYAGQRNYDFGPERRDNVSALSPWIRHRLITEEEVLRAVLARHSLSGAEKFVQEVFWRSYFKGWLEQRPSVWVSYETGLVQALNGLAQDQDLASRYHAAIEGRTGIDGFDAWARELVETGYLHNHARMWVASIWIFTLHLPWQLGADFFLRHLMDGDPASNTLSWRWVAGLHTKGKTYLARVSNIAKYTEDRFRPLYQLAGSAEPLVEATEHALRPIPPAAPMPEGAFLLLVTEEDCQPEAWLTRPPAGVLGLLATEARAPQEVGHCAQDFARGAVTDALGRQGTDQDVQASSDWAAPIIEAAQAAGVSTVLTAYAPVGPVAARLAQARPALQDAGITLHQLRRPYDDLAWPHASKGFFALKQKIPKVLQGLGLAG